MSMLIDFEPEGHVYHLNGERVPSVTQVLEQLNDFSSVPPDVLEAAREFGTHVHKAIELDIRGLLDWGSLDPCLADYVCCWRRFAKASGIVVLASEQRVASMRYRVAGTLDLEGLLSARPAIIDIKSGIFMERSVGPQTAAYDRLLAETYGGRPGRRRYCLQLNPTFALGYKLHPLTDPSDWPRFLQCRRSWREQNEYETA